MSHSVDFEPAKYIFALREGSYEAFDIIYNHYADKIYSFCMTQTRDRELSQDIVQDTFLKLWINRKNIDPDGNIQAFIFTMARHRIIDEFRKQVAYVEFEDYVVFENLHSAETQADQQLIYEDFLHRVELCKLRLSQREIEIFKMRREQNLPIKDIAKRLNLSQQTVKNYITSSLKVFRSVLLKDRFLIILLLVFLS